MEKRKLIDEQMAQQGLMPEDMISYWLETKQTDAIKLRELAEKILVPPKPVEEVKPQIDTAAEKKAQQEKWENIYLQVRIVLIRKLGVKPEEITPEAHLINELHADSLDMISIFMDLEKEFGITIQDKEAETLDTIGRLVDYLTKKV